MADFVTKFRTKDGDKQYDYNSLANLPTDLVNEKKAKEYADAAESNAKKYADEQIAEIPTPDVSGQIETHNEDETAHPDIREFITDLTTRLNALANSDDETLDQMAEIVEYIKSNKSLIENVTTNKVNVADIVNNLASTEVNKPLSAAQGKVLKELIDALEESLEEIVISGGTTITHEWNGTVLTVTSASGTSSADLQGPKGADGKSAYLAATEGGYAGSETTFNAALSNIPGHIASTSNPHKVTAEQVGARPNTWTPSASDVGAEPSGAISVHNTDTESHNDIRDLITGLTTRLNTLANSDDTTLDQMAEVVAYIKSNRTLIDSITTSKVNVADIVNNLTTNISNKPLSAAQGVVLKALIDAITVPTKVSQLTNDKGYITGYTETDPTVPAWAKAATKPTYTANEVGAIPKGGDGDYFLKGHLSFESSASDLSFSSGGIKATVYEQEGLEAPVSRPIITVTTSDTDGSNTNPFTTIAPNITHVGYDEYSDNTDVRAGRIEFYNQEGTIKIGITGDAQEIYDPDADSLVIGLADGDDNPIIMRGVNWPTQPNDATNKEYVDSKITYGTTDPGTGFSLESGKLYFVYEGTSGSDD